MSRHWRYRVEAYDELSQVWRGEANFVFHCDALAFCRSWRGKARIVDLPRYAVDEDPRVGPTVNALQPDAATYKARLATPKHVRQAGLDTNRLLFVRWLVQSGRVSDGEKAAAPAGACGARR